MSVPKAFGIHSMEPAALSDIEVRPKAERVGARGERPYSSAVDVELCAFEVSFLNENRHHHTIPGNLPCAIE